MVEIDARYINMQHAIERRAFVENTIQACKFSPSIFWERFEGIAVDDATVAQISTNGLKRPHVGCFLSHLTCIKSAPANGRHLLVAEDDVLFSPHTEALLNRAVEQLGNTEWDILFTDVCITSVHDMLKLFIARKTTPQVILNLRTLGFCGATCYVINAASKRKVIDALSAFDIMHCPYDLFLRQKIYEGWLTAFATFPFITTLSHFADASQISDGGGTHEEKQWNDFRRIVWTDAQADEVLQYQSSGKDISECSEEVKRVISFTKILTHLLPHT